MYFIIPRIGIKPNKPSKLLPYNNRNIYILQQNPQILNPIKEKSAWDCVQNFHTLFVQDDNETEADMSLQKSYWQY